MWVVLIQKKYFEAWAQAKVFFIGNSQQKVVRKAVRRHIKTLIMDIYFILNLTNISYFYVSFIFMFLSILYKQLISLTVTCHMSHQHVTPTCHSVTCGKKNKHEQNKRIIKQLTILVTKSWQNRYRMVQYFSGRRSLFILTSKWQIKL